MSTKFFTRMMEVFVCVYVSMLLYGIQVFTQRMGCVDGYYGFNCSFTCNVNCKQGTPTCDTVTGVCIQGCKAGYNGSYCTQPCGSGRFGENCANMCLHCLSGTNCNGVNGNWFQGDQMRYKFARKYNHVEDFNCGSGRFGENCVNFCHHCLSGANCNGVTGNCPAGCSPGFKGKLCDIGCENGHYSFNCNSTCNRNCKQGTPTCNTGTGVCIQGCRAGYNGSYCTQPCDTGRYGENCKNICGRCSSGTFCNEKTGICPAGCDPGFQGNKCDKICANGTYGKNCENHCHCLNNASCIKTNGSCPNGCDIMWAGPYCSGDRNLIRHIEAKTYQSGTFLNITDYNASKAIDGVEEYSVDSCQCCSVATALPTSWWMIDLGRPYLIAAIELFGRSDGKSREQLDLANVYAGNDSLASSGTHEYLIYIVPRSSATKYSFLKELNISLIAQKFLVRLNDVVLTLCEFKLLEKECHVGYYGNGCARRCNCMNNTGCNAVTGHCLIGACKPGWQGDACDQECPFRTYDQNCFSNCHCYSNTSCTKTDGICKKGYCEAGWQSQSCSQVCPFRRYGQNCTAECHCFNNTTCRNTDGICEIGFCEAGWRGVSCSQDCPDRTFGRNCSNICYCFDKSACNPISGTCHNGYCEAGWQGSSCSEVGNILLKLKGQVNTQMSSVAHNWTANRAIDGRVGPDPDTCHCCSGTENSQLSWWKLDLSQKISIKSIVIYSRDEESYYQHLKGFRLYLTNNTAQDSSAINTNTNTNITGNAYEINVPNTLARYVTIKRPGVLTICEVMIFEGECRMGTYGEECMKECHCADNKPCNKESGQCQTLICKTGWKGTACDQGCPQDRFGDGCKERCFCAEDTCTTSYGACPGNCRQGYHGPHCNIVLERDGITKQSENSSNKVATIGGSVGGSVAFLIIVIAAVYLFIRYRTKLRYKDEHKNDYTAPSAFSQQSENSDYDTLETVQDTSGVDNNSPYVNEQVTGV